VKFEPRSSKTICAPSAGGPARTCKNNSINSNRSKSYYLHIEAQILVYYNLLFLIYRTRSSNISLVPLYQELTILILHLPLTNSLIVFLGSPLS
jgi:hypothetical protein